jgi:hypothetical protein
MISLVFVFFCWWWCIHLLPTVKAFATPPPIIRTATTHRQKQHYSVSLNYKDPLDIAEADVPSLDRQEQQQQLLEQNDVGEIEDTSVVATASSTSAGAATAVSISQQQQQQQQQQQRRRSKRHMSPEVLPNLKNDEFAPYPHLFIPPERPESKKTNPVQTLAIEPVISTASSPAAATAKQQTNKSSLRRLLQPFTWLSSIVTSSKRIHNTDSSFGSKRRRRRRQRLHRDRILLRVPTILQRIKHTIQSRLEGRTVYVLALTNNKYYVGSTSNRKRRYKQHATNRGAKYTRIHGPIQYIHAEYRHVPEQYILGYESYITARLMYQYGINNVRGGMFCGIQNLDMKNVDILTYYIGHYCNLDYTHVYNSICHELQSTSSSSVSMNKNVVKDSVNDGEEILSSMVSAISTMPSSSSSSFATRSSRKRFRGSHESSLTPPLGNTKKRKKEHGSSSRKSSNNNNSGGKVHNNARCYICGEIGHNAASCSMRHVSSL